MIVVIHTPCTSLCTCNSFVGMFCFCYRASSSGNVAVVSKILSSPLWETVIIAHDKTGRNFVHHSVQFNCLGLISAEVRARIS